MRRRPRDSNPRLKDSNRQPRTRTRGPFAAGGGASSNGGRGRAVPVGRGRPRVTGANERGRRAGEAHGLRKGHPSRAGQRGNPARERGSLLGGGSSGSPPQACAPGPSAPRPLVLPQGRDGSAAGEPPC